MAHDPGPQKGTHDPSISETLLAMDVLDTIRRDDRLRDFALAEGDRREALIARLRQTYAAQGDVVSDEVIERAISKMNEARYVHVEKLKGVGSVLWGLYIDRKFHARRVIFAASACVFLATVSSYGYDRLVTQPRLERQREIELQLDTVLPRDLKSAVDYAMSYAERLDDKAAIARVEERRTKVETSILAKDLVSARNGIDLIRAVGEELLHREEAAAKAVAEARRLEEQAREKAATAARLVPKVETMTSGILAEISDAKARAALGELAAQMTEAAVEGNEASFEERYERFKSYAGYIRSPYTIQIVSRNGIQTGFSRTHDESGNKTWYLVVEAISPTGVAYPLEISDRLLNGRKKLTATWAVRVSKPALDAVRLDKQDGVLDNNVAGVKPAGKLDIDWKIDAFDGQTINTW
jgi:hypothetical protein